MHTLRGSWKTGVATAVLMVFGILADAYAQVIGPLTNEDPKEIRAMSGKCTRHGEQMKCQFIEMLVRQPRSAEERKKEVETLMAQWHQEKKEGKNSSDDLCARLPQLEQNLRTQFAGPEQEEGRKWASEFLRQQKKLCADSSSERNVSEFTQWLFDQADRTCQVDLFGSWEYDFAQQSKGLWVTQQGPQGRCGTVSVITLEEGKYSQWTYRSKRVITNPQGDKDLPESMRVCNKLQEHTLTFSNTKPHPKFRHCTQIEFSFYNPSP